ncbi:8776_t:CDS:2, partial [Racocetra persica]
LFENILQQHPKFQRRLKQYSTHEQNGVIKTPKGTFTPERLWDACYFKHVLDFIDEASDQIIAQHLGKMITTYINDFHTFSQYSPNIVKSILKSNDEKRRYRKHDNEIIGLIIDKCISYYNEDNNRFDVLCAITSSISELQKLYPYYVAQFFATRTENDLLKQWPLLRQYPLFEVSFLMLQNYPVDYSPCSGYGTQGAKKVTIAQVQ